MHIFTVIITAALLTTASFSSASAKNERAVMDFPDKRNMLKKVQAIDGLETRRALARQIHELRPITRQVSDALDYIAGDLTPADKLMFRQSVMDNMDIQELQSASITAMAQVFTAPELSAMAEYYAKPESLSIEEKSTQYRARIDPLIVAEINDSLTRLQASVAEATPAPTRP